MDYVKIIAEETPINVGPWPECDLIFKARAGENYAFAGLINKENGWLEIEYKPNEFGWVSGEDAIVQELMEGIKMATANERRIKVRDAYRKFIGRNHYSQARRNYAIRKYKDGKYYSDCSSSVSYAYKVAGESFGILNTVGMWTSKKMKDVSVKISKGIIQNPEVLKIGDMLLFAGNDSGRKKYGYVGHVEMVGEISGSKITLYGHGSGLAKKHEMNAYCKTRYNTKSSTPLGRRLLVKVRRAIWDSANETSNASETVVMPSTLSKGDKGSEVKAMQEKLIKLGYSCGPDGADGDFGSNTLNAVKAFQKDLEYDVTGEFDEKTRVALDAKLSAKGYVRIRHGNYYVRKAADKTSGSITVVYDGSLLPYLGESANGWNKVSVNGVEGWISSKAGDVVEVV